MIEKPFRKEPFSTYENITNDYEEAKDKFFSLKKYLRIVGREDLLKKPDLRVLDIGGVEGCLPNI